MAVEASERTGEVRVHYRTGSLRPEDLLQTITGCVILPGTRGLLGRLGRLFRRRRR
ncbi:MAG TPA: hypothetical protein VFV36_02270 [Candidatus Methylomirabilis sp.]|nr:hypothetical protein [Candidatus Methylomirabilis sp.]